MDISEAEEMEEGYNNNNKMIQDIEPKVFTKFKTSKGEIPREVLISRIKKYYKSQDLMKLLKKYVIQLINTFIKYTSIFFKNKEKALINYCRNKT